MDGRTAQSLVASPPTARFAFRLATADDDPAIRQLLRETVMDGAVRVTLRREPSFFESVSVEGDFHQALVAVDLTSSRVVGLGSRSMRERFVAGRAVSIGYLSALRINSNYRGGALLARGFRALYRLHRADPCAGYLTTIAEGNLPAIKALSGKRAGLPHYHFLAKYHTFVVPLKSRRRDKHAGDGLTVRSLRSEELPELLTFMREMKAEYNFLPVYSAADFEGPLRTFSTLPAGDIFVARRDSRIVACLGVWNQGAFKQTVIEGYSQALSLLRPGFNSIAKLLGWPRFPVSGSTLVTLTGALPIATPGELAAMKHVFDAARHHARQKYRTFDSIMVGACERDPHMEVWRRASLFRYTTNLYFVNWDDASELPNGLSNQPIYLELGCL